MPRKMIDGELEYVALYRSKVSTFTDEQLDRDRRLGEAHGCALILGDLTGNEMTELCDAEIAGRYFAKTEAA